MSDTHMRPSAPKTKLSLTWPAPEREPCVCGARWALWPEALSPEKWHRPNDRFRDQLERLGRPH
eukprot:2065256-Heterocapsa_arctica.AAC.1